MIDRRKGPDKIVKSIKWAITSCWLMLFVVWSYVYYARPEQATIFDPHGIYNKARSYWDISMLKKAFIAINVLLLISLIGLAVSTLRHNRSTDKVPTTLVIMLAMSIIGMAIIYFQF
ncbi:hypothetical protein [Candidatus Magnetominusculus xianensis]|uniref:DUF1648 domain-containing protein n=1 Tax=Candidatus Magnetominusculus xianensis TaxID=1748249 RepID=A0ABR5SIB6_9BACT|nr:hypothetical protein [Candidatus Magnetominusculus xianensis]KWT92065.1 hypothetical protein ASN18_0618 [Candidatus Magnetominusculus xianensis]MBF0404645.1 hypothetical protein [Nitrospirota bacterium]